MLKHQLGFGASLALLVTLFVGTSVAQQAPPAPAAQPGTQCGGQYECVEDRPLTPGEAQASRSHPQNMQQQEPAQVATTRQTVAKPSANERLDGTSIP